MSVLPHSSARLKALTSETGLLQSSCNPVQQLTHEVGSWRFAMGPNGGGTTFGVWGCMQGHGGRSGGGGGSRHMHMQHNGMPPHDGHMPDQSPFMPPIPHPHAHARARAHTPPPSAPQQQQGTPAQGSGRSHKPKRAQKGMEDNVRRTVYISYVDSQVID